MPEASIARATATADAIYAFGYMGLLIVIFFVWALRLYSDNIGRGAA